MNWYVLACGAAWWTVFLAYVAQGRPFVGAAWATLVMSLGLLALPWVGRNDADPGPAARRQP